MKNIKKSVVLFVLMLCSVCFEVNGRGSLFSIPFYFSNVPFSFDDHSEKKFDLILFQNSTYAVLKRKLDGGYCQITKGDLYFMMEGEYNNAILSYKIFDSKRIERVNSVNYANQNLNTGYNAYFMDLNANYGFSASDINQFFVLEITNQKKELFLLKFKYGQ